MKIAANEDAYLRLLEQIAEVQQTLDTAKQTIEADCKDVALQFRDQIAQIQVQISSLKAELTKAYHRVELTAESTIDTASIYSAIEELVTNAKAAQTEYENELAKLMENKAAYTRLTEQIVEVQEALDAAKDSIETNYKDVAGQFEEQIDSIQNYIDAMSADVQAKYENVELTAESVIDTTSISDAIAALLANAEKAQKEYEEALSIGSVNTEEKVIGIYSLTGKKVSQPQKGLIYLFRYESGKTVKKMVK